MSNKRIKKLRFETTAVKIEIFINNGDDREFKIGEILPRIDGTFIIESVHFIQPLLQSYPTIEMAEIEAQILFERWVNNFFI